MTDKKKHKFIKKSAIESKQKPKPKSMLEKAKKMYGSKK